MGVKIPYSYADNFSRDKTLFLSDNRIKGPTIILFTMDGIGKTQKKVLFLVAGPLRGGPAKRVCH